MNATNHAKQRAKERIGKGYINQNDLLFNKAIKYGRPPADFAGQFKSYLDNKLKQTKSKKPCKIKVYNNYIYIYSGKTIITVFPVPQMYLPISNYYAKFIKNNELLSKLYGLVGPYDVSLELVVKDNNEYVYGLYINDEFMNFGTGTNEVQARNNAVKQYLKNIGEM